MDIITTLLAITLSATSINSINIGPQEIQNTAFSQALLCSGNEMDDLISGQSELYLDNFDNPVTTVLDNGVFFSGSMSVADLFNVDDNYFQNALDYSVTFNATYMAGLDVCVIDTTLVKNGVDILKESAFVFPFYDQNGARDAKIVMNGYEYYRSELKTNNQNIPYNITLKARDALLKSAVYLELDELLPGLSIDADAPHTFSDAEHSGPVFSMLGIADAISGIDSVIGFGWQYVYTPLIQNAGPADCLFFSVKLAQIAMNFTNNSQKNHPYGFIYNQNDLSDWRFSFHGSLPNNGCGVVAAYNMLYDCNNHNKVDLPTLIALFEILNVDTLFGTLGANMIPSDYELTLTSYLESLAETAYLRLEPSATLFFNYPSFSTNLWLSDMLGRIGIDYAPRPYSKGIILDCMSFAFSSVSIITDYYSQYSHDLPFVIGLYIGSQYCHSTMSFYEFEADIEFSYQSIACYWIRVDAQGNPDVFSGAHFVYQKNYYSCYRQYNVFSNSSDYRVRYEVYELFGNTSDRPTAAQKMISAYTFYDDGGI